MEESSSSSVSSSLPSNTNTNKVVRFRGSVQSQEVDNDTTKGTFALYETKNKNDGNDDDFPSSHSHNDNDEEDEPFIVGYLTSLPLASSSSSSSPSSRNNNDDDHDTISCLEHFLFFGCALASSLGFISTLSSLVYFEILYGPNSFVDLNLAVYLPLLPISLAQAKWDHYYDLQYTTKRTFLVRGMLGFGLVLLGTIMIHNTSMNNDNTSTTTTTTNPHLISIIWPAMLQGTGSAILYGMLNQLASFVGVSGTNNNNTRPSNGTNNPQRLMATVSAGNQASAFLVLAISLLTGFKGHDESHFLLFLKGIIAMELLCFIMFVCLLLTRPSVTASLLRRDSSIQGLDDTSLHSSHNTATDIYNEETSDDLDIHLVTERLLSSQNANNTITITSTTVELGYASLYKYTASCCWTLIVTLIPSFLVASWFTRVHTSWMALPQVLFYTRIGSDFMGRIVTVMFPPRNMTCLTWTSIGRWGLVILFFVNASGKVLFLNPDHNNNNNNGMYSDILSIGLVSIISFLSGYLVTGCFQLAPMNLPLDVREANLSKQASLLTIAFAIAAILGLLSSFTLIAVGA